MEWILELQLMKNWNGTWNASSGPSPVSTSHPNPPLHHLNQCYLLRNTSHTPARLQTTLSSVRYKVIMLPWHKKAIHFSYAVVCCSVSSKWCSTESAATRGCKETSFHVSRKHCSSGILFHLKVPSLEVLNGSLQFALGIRVRLLIIIFVT